LTPAIQDLLSQDIERICKSDPRVTPTQLNISEFNSGYLVEITLQLTDSDQSANLRLTFDQQAGLIVQ
jgi:hypothetical protein